MVCFTENTEGAQRNQLARTFRVWRPPNLMKFDIVASDVPGRPWLTFQDASYEITSQNGRTVVTRSTTIVSRLSPSWYWRPMERIGVETEHEYLFEELKRRIGAK